MGGVEHPHEDLLVDGLAVELGPDVAPAVDDVVETGEHVRTLQVHAISSVPAARGVRLRMPSAASPHTGRSRRRPSGARTGQGSAHLGSSLRSRSTDHAWTGDACSLVDAFRKGEITPPEALELSLAAIEASALNAFSHVDADAARRAAPSTPTSRSPSEGSPSGSRSSSRSRAGRSPRRRSSTPIASPTYTSTQVRRLRAAGAVLAAQTTASEFGGINITYTRLHGTTRNPWNLERTPGGSSGGTAAAVAGGTAPHRVGR